VAAVSQAPQGRSAAEGEGHVSAPPSRTGEPRRPAWPLMEAPLCLPLSLEKNLHTRAGKFWEEARRRDVTEASLKFSGCGGRLLPVPTIVARAPP
jgi:hypothetical protein